MIKKILLALIFFMTFFVQSAFAQEVFKVTSVNFDTSNAMIFLTSPDNTTEPILKNIKLVKLSNPNRAFFDINSAVLTAPSQHWYFNSGGLKQIKIGQFSTNPNKIRVVMYFDEQFNPKNISFLKVNNNIVIKLKDGICKDDYFQTTYQEENAPNFYEPIKITSEEPQKPNNTSDIAINNIQQAFKNVDNLKPVLPSQTECIKKELKLNTKYYINKVVLKENGVLLSGIGSGRIEKPLYLTSPARVVFDIPNAVTSPELKNKEFKINDKETFKIAQFSTSMVRVVITSNELEKYIPIFSADSQAIIFANPDQFDVLSIFEKTTDAIGYYYQPVNKTTDEFVIAFNAPLVHAIKRDNSKVTIYLYNALRYNETNFKNAIANTTLSSMKLDLLPKVGLKLTIPLRKDNTVNCFLGTDAKSIKIRINGSKEAPGGKIAAIAPSVKKVYLSSGKAKSGCRTVVLDPGHGGVDYGAIRAGINEKDINLDVAKRVEAILESKGIKVYMTRNTDETVSLQDRTIFSGNKNPDIFVSIHVNSSTGTEANGVETHYYHPISVNLAQTVHSALACQIKCKDRGLLKSKFYVINHTTVPAILVEIGFISNDRERAELVSEQRKQQTAKGIADGILRYLGK